MPADGCRAVVHRTANARALGCVCEPLERTPWDRSDYYNPLNRGPASVGDKRGRDRANQARRRARLRAARGG